MKCGKCEALLWNTPPGKCPKCQAPFGVRDYRFVWHSVKFRCPRCNDVVLGRDLDESGHPAVLHMTCMGCGEIVHFDQVLVEPNEGTQPIEPEGPANWWERVVGVPRSDSLTWTERFMLALSRDGKTLIKGVPEDEPVWSSAIFAGVVLTLVILATMLPLTMYALMSDAISASEFLLGQILLAGSIYMAVLIWIGAAHTLIMATGDNKGPTRTAQAIFLGSPCSFTLLFLWFTPCCPPLAPLLALAGWAYWAVTSINMMIAGHAIAPWRCYLATLLPLFVLMGGYMAWVVIAFQ